MRLQKPKSKVNTFGDFPRTIDLGGLDFNSRFGKCCFLCVPELNGTSMMVPIVLRPGGLLQKKQVEVRRVETQTRNASVLACFFFFLKKIRTTPIGLNI